MTSLSALAGKTITTQGHQVVITMEDIDRGYMEAQAAEIRKAIRGKGGYTTDWPKPARRKRGSGPRRVPPSIGKFRVKARYKPGKWKHLELLHTQTKGVLLETRPMIRGYDNVHYLAQRTSLGKQWNRISQNAMNDTARRAEARVRRRTAVQLKKGAAVQSAARTRRIGRIF